MKVRAQVNKTIDTLEQHGYEAYIVGGAVRNMLLELPVRDYDICTSASVAEMKKIFPKHTDIGGNFGTLLVHQGSHAFEVSQFKHASMEEKPSIMTDLKYRDFSCNAIAMTKEGSLLDPFDGIEAIGKKVIRVVNGDPERLKEDPLRLLRGIRLALTLDFQIDYQTEKWMKEYAGLIKEPAKERIAQELEKLFKGSISRKKLSYLLSHPLLAEIPFIFPKRIDMLAGLEKLDDSFFIQGSIQGWMLAAFSDDMSRTRSILKAYRCSKQTVKAVSTVVKEAVVSKKDGRLTDVQLYILRSSGIQASSKLLSIILGKELPIQEFEERFQQLPIQSLGELAISGKELLEWFPVQAQSGAWIGSTLKEVERKVLLRQLYNDKQDIYEWIKKGTFS